MFVHKTTPIYYNRASMLITAPTGFIDQPVSSRIPATLIAWIESAAAALVDMEAMLATSGFDLLHHISRGTQEELAFDEIIAGNISSYVIKSEPVNHPYGALSNSPINKVVPLAMRYYRFGDAETVPLYFSVELSFIGVNPNLSRNSARPFTCVRFFSNENFLEPIDFWYSAPSANYEAQNIGSGSRQASFIFAANNNNLILSLENIQTSFLNAADYEHFGYVNNPSVPYGLCRPIMFSKTRVVGVDTDKPYVSVCQTSPIYTAANTSNAEDMVLPIQTYNSSYNRYYAKHICAFDVDTRGAGIGIPRSGLGDTQVGRVQKPLHMDYFYVNASGVVFEYLGVTYGAILSRNNFSPDIGVAMVNGQSRQIFQLPGLGPFMYTTHNLLWSCRAQSLGIYADV